MRLPRPPVLLITDRTQAAAPLERVVAAALEAGCRWVLLREKDLEPGARRALLCRLVELGRPHGAWITVSADLDAAAAAGAAGVHLPAGGDPARARSLLGPEALIGVSAHDKAEARSAADAGADYVTLSPIFASPSKPGYGPALGPDGLQEAAACLSVPVIALGGLAPGNAASCLAAGAAGIAVMGEIMRAPDPGAAMRSLIQVLTPAGANLCHNS